MLDLFLWDLYFSAVGYSIVFLVLLMLCLLVSILRRVEDKLQNVLQDKVKPSSDHQNIDDTTMILISAAVATYFKGGAYVKRIRVLPSSIRSSSWSAQGRTSIQSSHSVKK